MTTDPVDVEVGARVHAAMWRARLTQAQVSKHLGLDQAAVSRRLRGATAWKVSELLRISQLLHIAATDLLPDPGLGDSASGEVTSHERSRRAGARHAKRRERRGLRLLPAADFSGLVALTSGI